MQHLQLLITIIIIIYSAMFGTGCVVWWTFGWTDGWLEIINDEWANIKIVVAFRCVWLGIGFAVHTKVPGLPSGQRVLSADEISSTVGPIRASVVSDPSVPQWRSPSYSTLHWPPATLGVLFPPRRPFWQFGSQRNDCVSWNCRSRVLRQEGRLPFRCGVHDEGRAARFPFRQLRRVVSGRC